ncbi:hypothetical protein EDB19DRAFT_1829541 [Suillus lakei]|nr:hypothetical protein EDB19DRAFT_1829541 [Suillus lakei]
MARSESPVIMHQQTKLPLIKAEIAVLKAHLEDWRLYTRKLAFKLPLGTKPYWELERRRPEATKAVLTSVLAEEKGEANVLADKWNNEATVGNTTQLDKAGYVWGRYIQPLGEASGSKLDSLMAGGVWQSA